MLSKTDNNYKVGLTGTTNPEVFYQRLAYYKNGNVDTMDIRNNQAKAGWPELVFDYSYDVYNRLTGANCGNSQYNSSYAYDNDGNFTYKSNGNDIINYTEYFTSTNRLKTVSSVNKAGRSFTYDDKGRLLKDGYSGVNLGVYNYQNLPLVDTVSSVITNYSYNGNGERITKNSDYYLRDFAGRELAIYDNTADTLKSVNLYGNGMIGRYLANENKSIYFAKDHLGTIRTTINDYSEIENAADYYPYGEEITGRSVVYPNCTSAKYKFTGKERDTENGYDYFGARYYDSRIGRWLQIDPLANKYPEWNPYNYVKNNPSNLIDPNGMDIWVVTRDADGNETSRYQYINRKLIDSEGNEYKGDNSYLTKVRSVLNSLLDMDDSKISEVITGLENSSLKHEISDTPYGFSSAQSAWSDKSNEGERQGSYVWFDISGLPKDGKEQFSFETVLGHELYHSYDFDKGNMKGYLSDIQEKLPFAKLPHEVRAVMFGNRIRNHQGLKARTTYDGMKINFNNNKIRR